MSRMKNLFNWTRDVILFNDIPRSFYKDREPLLILHMHEEASKGLKWKAYTNFAFQLLSYLLPLRLQGSTPLRQRRAESLTTFPAYCKLLPVKGKLGTLFRLLPFKYREYIHIQTDISLGSLEFIRSKATETAL